MVALCSKSYYVWGENGDKLSCKGCQKSTNIMNRDHYISCLNKNEFQKCTNKGFRVNDKIMKTYVQEKIALTPLYSKGIVLKNGINIAPLDI